MEKEKILNGFSERLRGLMRNKGFDGNRNLKAFAKSIGKESSAVSNWIKGRNLPNSMELIALCDKLGTTPNYLLLGIESERRKNFRRAEDEVVHNLIKILQVPNQEFTLKVKLESLRNSIEKP
jgi:transcriptional regulator with XRE-family HTH domain